MIFLSIRLALILDCSNSILGQWTGEWVQPFADYTMTYIVVASTGHSALAAVGSSERLPDSSPLIVTESAHNDVINVCGSAWDDSLWHVCLAHPLVECSDVRVHFDILNGLVL